MQNFSPLRPRLRQTTLPFGAASFHRNRTAAGTAFGSGDGGSNTSDASPRGSRKAVNPYTWLVCAKIVKRGRGEREPTQGSMFNAGHEPTQDIAFGEGFESTQSSSTTGPKSRGLVFPEGDIADPNAQRTYRRVGAVGVGLFFGCSEGGFLRVSASE